jgi:hypothetical protein
MGTFAYGFEIDDFEGKRFVPIDALVDTSATYSAEGFLVGIQEIE